MKAQVKDLQALLNAVCTKEIQNLDHPGLLAAAREITGITERYLYNNIYIVIKKRQADEFVPLSTTSLNHIAHYLGHTSYLDFVNKINRKSNSLLESCIGNYYCYVRRNTPDMAILRSPVAIFMEGTKVMFELKGPTWTYRGELHTTHGCLFVLMTAEEGKSFYHVYKVGTQKKPEVLQGTFSGVSTNFDPIGGRTVLIRVEKPYKQLTCGELMPGDLKKDATVAEKKLGLYFKSSQGNNLNPIQPRTFRIADL